MFLIHYLIPMTHEAIFFKVKWNPYVTYYFTILVSAKLLILNNLKLHLMVKLSSEHYSQKQFNFTEDISSD